MSTWWGSQQGWTLAKTFASNASRRSTVDCWLRTKTTVVLLSLVGGGGDRSRPALEAGVGLSGVGVDAGCANSLIIQPLLSNGLGALRRAWPAEMMKQELTSSGQSSLKATGGSPHDVTFLDLACACRDGTRTQLYFLSMSQESPKTPYLVFGGLQHGRGSDSQHTFEPRPHASSASCVGDHPHIG